MARLSDADQSGLPLPRLDSCGANRARLGVVPRSSAAHAGATPPWYSGMAKLLLQVADDRAGAVSGARSVHPTHEAEEHFAAPQGRRVDYTSGAGVLRLARVERALLPAFFGAEWNRVRLMFSVQHIGRLCIDPLGDLIYSL